MSEVNLRSFVKNKARVVFLVDFRFVDIIDDKLINIECKSGEEAVISLFASKVLEERGIVKIKEVV